MTTPESKKSVVWVIAHDYLDFQRWCHKHPDVTAVYIQSGKDLVGRSREFPIQVSSWFRDSFMDSLTAERAQRSGFKLEYEEKP